MDKTVAISLGGFSFTLDEIAFKKLKIYLDDVRNSLHDIDGVDDIIEDVEIRIAELFRERLSFREVVSNDDIDFVIATMGHPNQYRVEEEVEEVYIKTERVGIKPTKKRLFRDPDDKIISGLSAGLAHYFGLDSWAIRAGWLILGFLGIFGGFSLLFVLISYVVLLAIVPLAKTTSEKLQMYGKPANIETLKKNAQEASEAVANGGRELSSKLGGVFSLIGKILFGFLGAMICLIGVSLIIGGFAIAFTTWTDIPTELFGYLVEDKWMSIATKISGGLLAIIPGILITLLGVRCFTKLKINKALIISSIIVWFIALFSIIGISLNTASKFKSNVERSKDQSFNIPSDTLVVNFKDEKDGDYIFNSIGDLEQLIDENGNLLVPIDDQITIKESDDNNFKIDVKYSSKGGNSKEAKRNLESIDYNYQIKENQLILDEFIKIKPSGKFRNQTVDITLYIPKNKIILTKGVDRIITDNQGETNNFYDNINKLFINNGEKIVCLNCENEDGNSNEYEDDFENIEINVEDSSDKAKVKIDKNGIRIESNDGTVGISTNSKKNNNQINYKDDTDNINIDYGSN